jgi:hypothetical protein
LPWRGLFQRRTAVGAGSGSTHTAHTGGRDGLPMTGGDELAARRFARLVDRVEMLMRGCLNPEHEGYCGHLVLGRAMVAEIGERTEIRRAACSADRRLGWKTATRETDGCIHIPGTWELPEVVQALEEERATQARDAAWRGRD